MEHRKTRTCNKKNVSKLQEIYYCFKKTPNKAIKKKSCPQACPLPNRHLTRGSKLSILQKSSRYSSKKQSSVVRFGFNSFTCYMDICNGNNISERCCIAKRRSTALTIPNRKQFGFFLSKSPTTDLPNYSANTRRSFFILNDDCCIPVLSIDYRRQAVVQTSSDAWEKVKCRDQSQNCTLVKVADDYHKPIKTMKSGKVLASDLHNSTVEDPQEDNIGVKNKEVKRSFVRFGPTSEERGKKDKKTFQGVKSSQQTISGTTGDQKSGISLDKSKDLQGRLNGSEEGSTERNMHASVKRNCHLKCKGWHSRQRKRISTSTSKSTTVPNNSEDEDSDNNMEKFSQFKSSTILSYSDFFASNTERTINEQGNTLPELSMAGLEVSECGETNMDSKDVRMFMKSLQTGQNVCTSGRMSVYKSDAIFTSTTVEGHSRYSRTTSTALYFDPIVSSFTQVQSASCRSDSLFSMWPRTDRASSIFSTGTICSEQGEAEMSKIEASDTTFGFHMEGSDQDLKADKDFETILIEMQKSCTVQQDSSLEDLIRQAANFRSTFENLRRTSDSLRDKYDFRLNLHDTIREEAQRRCNLKLDCTLPVERKENVVDIEIVDVKSIGGGSLLVMWQVWGKQNLIGYEIFVDQELKKRVYTANRTCITLEGLDLGRPISIAIFALATNGRCETPAQILCRPKNKIVPL